jgi:pyrimidine-nucleoside phosphorylase
LLVSELIQRKRDGGVLAASDLQAFFQSYMQDRVADYQMSAFLMAVFFRGLDPSELATLTRTIIESGRQLDFSGDGPPAVDKHSTGGVGDKVSLILAPLVAEAGLRVPMISGRGLGHTGGTLDKYESIPGFRTALELNEFEAIVADVGCAVIGQTPEITPLDGRLYALRDVTGTVKSVPLIASRIISKKVAEGVEALVLDVKCGRGAFMQDEAEALELGRVLVDLAASEGVRATGLVTDMETPLGRTIGNALEAKEAIECLLGGGPTDLREVTLALSAELLVSAGVSSTRDEATTRLERLLADGSAAERFIRQVERQGGDPRVVADPDRLPVAPVQREYRARQAGTITRLDARELGLAAVELGAGRTRVEDEVDPRVGFVLEVCLSDPVEQGDLIAMIHAADEASAGLAADRLARAISISEKPLSAEQRSGVSPTTADRAPPVAARPPARHTRLLQRITPQGVEPA